MKEYTQEEWAVMDQLVRDKLDGKLAKAPYRCCDCGAILPIQDRPTREGHICPKGKPEDKK